MRLCNVTSLTLAALVLATLSAAPAVAGIHYQAETRISPEKGKPQVTRVEGWVDGPKAKVVFAETSQPMMEKNSYLLTQDGGQTLFLVNPEEKTYMEWDLQGMLSAFGGMMQAMGGLVDLEFSDVSVETLETKDGGELLGYPVAYTKYKSRYTTSIKVFGMQRGSTTETIQEVWATRSLSDVGLGVWLRSEPPVTGLEELDKLLASEMDKIDGFPLKTVAVSTSTGQKGKRESTSRTETTVTLLEETSVAGDAFEIPAGYTQTQMMEEQ